jgi:chromate transport protein ChrA
LLLAKLAWFFLMTGPFTFGGGLAVVPLLEKGLVGQWLTTGDFLTAIAAGMVTPGPVMTAATFTGGWGPRLKFRSAISYGNLGIASTPIKSSKVAAFGQ